MRTVIFCHGMPGSELDADLLRHANPSTNIIALNLLDVDPEQMERGLQDAFDEAFEQADNKPVDLVGFSIGAMVATRLATLHPANVSQLILVSPAAPLSLGDFLPNMAGKPVFELALKHPKLLRLLTRFQGSVARVSPRKLTNMLFAKCGAIEKQLLEEPLIRSAMAKALSASLVEKPASYIAYVSAYVSEWSGILLAVKCPVVLWHGTKDTWSPPEMSKKLEAAFESEVTLNWVENAEHYSTLTKVSL